MPADGGASGAAMAGYVIGGLAVAATIGVCVAAKEEYEDYKKKKNAKLAKKAREMQAGAVTIGVYRHGTSLQQADWIRPLLPKMEKANQQEKKMAVFAGGEKECQLCQDVEAKVMYLPCGHVVTCCSCDLVIWAYRLNKIVESHFQDEEVITKQFIIDRMQDPSPAKRLQIRCGYCREPVQERKEIE